MSPHRPLAWIPALAAALALTPASSQARTRDSSDFPRFESLTSPTLPANRGALSSSVYGGAVQDTVLFGGTFWNADSSRWEALRDSIWTFDTGVGSSIVPPGGPTDPGVDPFKKPGLHQTMEGWVGIDNTFGPTAYFRRISSAQSACVGTAGGLGGSWSFYAGVLPDEAAALCYVGGAGYGNSWHVCLAKTFSWTGGNVTLSYTFANDTEPGYDFTTVKCDTSGGGGDTVTLISYDGMMSGTETLTLHPGAELPTTAPHDVVLEFCFDSDGSYSDQDGSFVTTCGAFALDNVALSGGIVQPLEDFEAGDGGWALLPLEPGAGGEWSNLVSLTDLPPPVAPCACSLQDSVMVFIDETLNGHNLHQDNMAASPWIDLKGNGLMTQGKLIRADVYGNLPLLNYIFFQYQAQYYPMVCTYNGKLVVSPWVGTGLFFFFDGNPYCTAVGNARGEQVDFSNIIPASAEKVRIAIGIFSSCQFFANCTGTTNTSPWFDRVALGVYGVSGAPILSARGIDLPLDSFPENGSLAVNATGRVDCNSLKGAAAPAPGTSLGDTLVVSGGTGPDPVEVRVQFAVHPGPGVNAGNLQTWITRHQYEGAWNGLQWYSARMDTAEAGEFGRSPGIWMTAYHEEDPNFTGTDRSKDPNDLDSQGHMTHLLNDIFPDHLFTPGTRLMLFYKAHYIGNPVWYILPDTAGGNTFEMEVLPSSMEADGTHNDILFVDHVAGLEEGARLDAALHAVLPVLSTNYEHTAWDRFDVRGAGSIESSFGRPAFSANYGATLTQALGYRTIIWDSGSLTFGSSLSKEDVAVLDPWLSMFVSGAPDRCLYLSGDGIVTGALGASSVPAEIQSFMTDVAAVTLRCSAFRIADCPTGSLADPTPCVELDRTIGARTVPAPRTSIQVGQGNGCPNLRAFDVIFPNEDAVSMSPVAEERYEGDVKAAPYSSISNQASGAYDYKTVVDGLSVRHRRDAGACQSGSPDPPQAMVDRLTEVLTWFGTPHVTHPTGIDPVTPYRTALLPVAPNPVRGGSPAHLAYTLAQAGPARIAVYDMAGRRVREVFSGPAREGENEAVWDLRDDRGIPVAAGVYFTRLEAAGANLTRKIVIATGP